MPTPTFENSLTQKLNSEIILHKFVIKCKRFFEHFARLSALCIKNQLKFCHYIPFSEAKTLQKSTNRSRRLKPVIGHLPSGVIKMVMTLPVNKLKYLVCLRADRQRRHVISFHLRNKNRGDKAAFFLRFYSTFYTLCWFVNDVLQKR